MSGGNVVILTTAYMYTSDLKAEMSRSTTKTDKNVQKVAKMIHSKKYD